MTGLEAIEIIRDRLIEYKNKAEGTNIKCLISPQFAQVRTELKALEIIKEKECDVSWLKYCIKENLIVEAYNSGYPEYHKHLTEEEFDTLKGILNEE